MAPAVTLELIAAEARRLGEAGPFTSRQLYYAVCAALEEPPLSITKGMVGLGAVLVVLAGVIIRVHPYVPSIAVVSAGAAFLLAAPLNAAFERRRNRARAERSRPRALGWEEFSTGPLQRCLHEMPGDFTALVGLEAASRLEEPPPSSAAGAGPGGGSHAGSAGRSRAAAGTVLACDRVETANLLRASLDRLPPLGAVLLVPEAPDQPAPLASGSRVVVIHDADPTGCGIVSRLRQAGAARVVDAGLQPPASDAGLQVIEGAPARVGPGLEADLSPDQIAWLLSGRRLELATLTTSQLLERLVFAIESLDAPRPAGASAG